MNKGGLKQVFWRNNKCGFLIAFVSNMLISLFGIYISYILQVVTDVVAGVNTSQTLTGIIIWVGIALATMGIVGVIRAKSLYRFKEKAVRQYKDELFSRIMQKGLGAFKKESASVYLSGMTNDVTVIEESYLESIFSIGSNILMLAGSLIMMLYYSPLLTGIAIGLSIVPILAGVLTGKKLPGLEKNVSEKNGSFLAQVEEILNGFSVIKCFKAESRITGIFCTNNSSLEISKKARNIKKYEITLIGTLAGAFTQIGVFIAGAWLSLSGKGVTPGMLLLFTNLMNFIIAPIGQLPVLFAGRQAAKGLIDKMEKALEESGKEEGCIENCRHEEEIRVKDLRFSYDESKKVLDGITYAFEKGKSYAIVGASGCGKSTLIQLLLEEMSNYEGTIEYDGTELREISPDSLYDIVSTIQQNVFVFNASIRDNITMFMDFSKEEVDRVIQMSGLKEVIREKGEDYLCGENGSGLSGGEKQRVSIARALLRNSRVLLIDEATAALDAETSNLVVNEILKLEDITRIIVTHDLDGGTLQQYDAILTMKDGKIVEDGSFEELMNNKGYFYSLYTISQ